MVKPTAHDGLDECSNHSGLNIRNRHILFGISVRVLELVDRAILRFAGKLP